MKRKLLPCIACLFFWNLSYSQHLEIGLGFGNNKSNIDFHHSSKVTTDDDKKWQTYWNSNFNINLCAPISKNRWYLKSEIGFLKINSFFRIVYDYDEGHGIQKGSLLSYLTNQKIYFSIAPQYRIELSSAVFKISAGPMITSDIFNVLTTSNSILLPKSSPPGFKIETGIQFNFKNIGAEFNIGYAKIGQSELQNRWHPKISYNLIVANFGIIYSMNTKKKEDVKEN
ncbi:MAG: hypothetical protein IPO65_16665 [Saprospiraceae bacterium]|nr:hypothetical protein [Saprospiraceae bacterium]MBK9689297.1 hypothetical protein [Saprospiraceae bacterium]